MMTTFEPAPRRLGIRVWLVAAVLVGGCAAQPDDIQPQQVSDLQYIAYSCPDLAKEQVRVDHVLSKLSSEQWQTRVDDVYGYIFLLMPLGRIAGRDLESQIALFKGEREAVGRVTTARGCSRVL